jgi:hypothetical protein
MFRRGGKVEQEELKGLKMFMMRNISLKGLNM